MTGLVLCEGVLSRAHHMSCIYHTAKRVTGGVGTEACREGLLWLVNFQGHVPWLLLLPRLAHKRKGSGLLVSQMRCISNSQQFIVFNDSNSIFIACEWRADGEIIKFRYPLLPFTVMKTNWLRDLERRTLPQPFEKVSLLRKQNIWISLACFMWI